MSTYSIKDLERISSMKAHTIRIWEQRYGLLEPERTDTNIRLYNDDQLKKLLNVCTLLNRGMKISKISKLTKDQLAGEIERIIAEPVHGDEQVEAIINQALIAVATYDVLLFESIFSNAVRTFGIYKIYEKILYPLLVRTGLMWIKDDLLPSQEHFLSNLIRQKLFSAINHLPLPENPEQKWVLFLDEQEDHEIGLLFAHYLIREHGHAVIYLGARVPYKDLVSVIVQCKPTHIYSFMVSIRLEERMEKYFGQLKADFNEYAICISGGDEKSMEMAHRMGIISINSIDSLIEILNNNAN
jgi:DNA-binding transcriptional MerR regulator